MLIADYFMWDAVESASEQCEGVHVICMRIERRPIFQWPRLKAGYSDDLKAPDAERSPSFIRRLPAPRTYTGVKSRSVMMVRSSA
jgi:hypothetical protein